MMSKRHSAARRVDQSLVGQTAQIELDNPAAGNASLLSGKIASVGNRSIAIVNDVPCVGPLPGRGSRATLTVAREDGLRVFSARITSQSSASLAFTLLDAPLRVQRRRDFRLPLRRQVRFLPAATRDCRAERFATLIDLSGGGAHIEADSAVAAGERLKLAVPMGSFGDPGWVDALVLSCSPLQSRGGAVPKGFAIRLTFDDDLNRVSLPESRRDEIVRYLFAEQRAMLKLRRLLAPAEETHKRTGAVAALLNRLRSAL